MRLVDSPDTAERLADFPQCGARRHGPDEWAHQRSVDPAARSMSESAVDTIAGSRRALASLSAPSGGPRARSSPDGESAAPPSRR